MTEPIVIPPPPVRDSNFFLVFFGLVMTTPGIGGIVLSIGLAGRNPLWFSFCIFLTFFPFLGIGVWLLGIAWYWWRVRFEPLIIETTGNVLFRGATLFDSATRLIIRVKILSCEGGSYERFYLLADTPRGEIDLPSPCFDSFGTRKEAEAVAASISEALGIPVVFEG